MHTETSQPARALAEDSIAFLRQGMELLSGLSDRQFRSAMPPLYSSGVGAHFRHIIDHFNSLMDGIADGAVDYDRRERDPQVEVDREAALSALANTVERVATLADQPGDLPLRVKTDCGGPEDATTWSQSSLARELQFVTSHTIHHYALVATILDHAGGKTPPGFGISPSTLNYEKRRRAQAR